MYITHLPQINLVEVWVYTLDNGYTFYILLSSNSFYFSFTTGPCIQGLMSHVMFMSLFGQLINSYELKHGVTPHQLFPIQMKQFHDTSKYFHETTVWLVYIKPKLASGQWVTLPFLVIYHMTCCIVINHNI